VRALVALALAPAAGLVAPAAPLVALDGDAIARLPVTAMRWPTWFARSAPPFKFHDEAAAAAAFAPAVAVAPGVDVAPGAPLGVVAVEPLVPVAPGSCCTLLNMNMPSALFCRQPVIVMSPAAPGALCVCGADVCGAGVVGDGGCCAPA
jgi:hypothetical protein